MTRLRRLLTVLLLLVAALSCAGPAGAQERAPDVAVLGVAGLRWADVGPRTPALRSLADRGAVGVLSVKARPAVSCAGDGWLTLGAGARAELFGERGCGLAQPDLSPEDLQRQRRRNAATPDGAVVGALDQALDADVVAGGPGALLALGRAGTRDRATARVRLVDLGGVDAETGGDDVARVDRRLARELARLPPATDVVVVGVSAAVGAEDASLHVAVAAGPSFPRGALRSASTRRAPYVQLVDVAPTVLDLVDVPVPAVMDGQPWQVVGAAPTVATLAELAARAATARRVTVPFFVVLVGALAALLVATWRRPRALRLVALAGTAAPGASYAAQLVPWERSPAPLLTLLALVTALALLAALATRSVGGVCGLTVAVLVVDLLAGGPLQTDAVAGYSPLVAGRFAGLGNVAFGVYGTCWLLATASLVHRRGPSPLLVGVLGTVAVLVAGAPAWGSDVGGVLALLPAFVVLALRTTDARVSVLRLLLALAAAAALAAALALLDLARSPQDRTHLGRFTADLRDGTAGELLERKASAVLGLLLSSPVTALLPLLAAAAVLAVIRPPAPLRRAFADVPALRHALSAVAVLSALGFVLNDSGAAVPALALLVGVPAVVAVLAASALATSASATSALATSVRATSVHTQAPGAPPFPRPHVPL